MKRLFIGIPAPEFVHDMLRNCLADIRISPASIRLVEPSGYHSTLVFIGATPEDALPAIVEATDAAARAVKQFTVIAEQVAFLPPREPRTVVMTIAPSQPLSQLHETLAGSMRALKLIPPFTRPFRPHVTLARFRQTSQAPTRPAVVTPPDKRHSLSWKASRIVVYESHLGSTGSRYDELHSVDLEKTHGSTYV